MKKKSAGDYLNEWCTLEADKMIAKLTLGREEDERDVYMSVGRGRGPHQLRNYSTRPPVQITKEILHCHGLPAFLATRRALSRPAPGPGCSFCYVMGRRKGRGYCNYH